MSQKPTSYFAGLFIHINAAICRVQFLAVMFVWCGFWSSMFYNYYLLIFYLIYSYVIFHYFTPKIINIHHIEHMFLLMIYIYTLKKV